MGWSASGPSWGRGRSIRDRDLDEVGNGAAPALISLLSERYPLPVVRFNHYHS